MEVNDVIAMWTGVTESFKCNNYEMKTSKGGFNRIIGKRINRVIQQNHQPDPFVGVIYTESAVTSHHKRHPPKLAIVLTGTYHEQKEHTKYETLLMHRSDNMKLT